jgi:hypothetical protein
MHRDQWHKPTCIRYKKMMKPSDVISYLDMCKEEGGGVISREG